MASDPPSGLHTTAQTTGEPESGTGSEQGQWTGNFGVGWDGLFYLGEGVQD